MGLTRIQGYKGYFNERVCMCVCIFYLGDKSFIWGLNLLFMKGRDLGTLKLDDK